MTYKLKPIKNIFTFYFPAQPKIARLCIHCILLHLNVLKCDAQPTFRPPGLLCMRKVAYECKRLMVQCVFSVHFSDWTEQPSTPNNMWHLHSHLNEPVDALLELWGMVN